MTDAEIDSAISAALRQEGLGEIVSDKHPAFIAFNAQWTHTLIVPAGPLRLRTDLGQLLSEVYRHEASTLWGLPKRKIEGDDLEVVTLPRLLYDHEDGCLYFLGAICGLVHLDKQCPLPGDDPVVLYRHSPFPQILEVPIAWNDTIVRGYLMFKESLRCL